MRKISTLPGFVSYENVWRFIKPILWLQFVFILIFYSDLIFIPLTKGLSHISFDLSGDLLGFLSFLNYFFLFPLGVAAGVASVLDKKQKWSYIKNTVVIGTGIPTVFGLTWMLLRLFGCGFFTDNITCDDIARVIPLIFLIYNSFFALSSSFLMSMYLRHREINKAKTCPKKLI